MSTIIKVLTVALGGIALATVASAQGVISERNVSMQLARAIADAAMTCAENGVGLSVAVVDRAGQLRVLMRGDGSPPQGIELARRI